MVTLRQTKSFTFLERSCENVYVFLHGRVTVSPLVEATDILMLGRDVLSVKARSLLAEIDYVLVDEVRLIA